MATSFDNASQATGDTHGVFTDALNFANSGNVLLWDLMANDLGGHTKTLFSIDDGAGNELSSTDLLNADVLVNGKSEWRETGEGNRVRIKNGKLELDVSNSLSAFGVADINSLTASDQIHDTFVYVVRLGNGTLSWAIVTFNLRGESDASSISGGAEGALGEDHSEPVTSTFTAIDPDQHETHTQTATDAATISGLGTYSVDAEGHWSYTVNNELVQYLEANQSATDSFVVYSLNGTARETVTVTINGTNDILTFSRTVHASGRKPFSIAVGVSRQVTSAAPTTRHVFKVPAAA